MNVTVQQTGAGRKVVNLALQGGGSHGAFTWGVLDRLLEDERLFFDGIAATSAGAINAVVLADGLAAGGRDGARRALRQFWQTMSAKLRHGILQPSMLDRMNPDRGLDHSPGFMLMDFMSYFTSPYQINPLNINPLGGVLEEFVDFERLRQHSPVKLFLCATDVRTCKVKVFPGRELSVRHVLASTCLPLMSHAVEIDGEYYWDGGFSGNPAIFPLVYECDSLDVVVVHITPANRPVVPTGAHAIMNRIQEIHFNTALIKEMRAVSLLNRMLDDGRLAEGKQMLMHVIEAEDVIRPLAGSSRLNSDWAFLTELHAVGRQRAEAWLDANFDQLGKASTVDLETKYF
jgi:NTE family protein